MALLVKEVLDCLNAYPALREMLTWQQIHRFLNFCRRIWPEIMVLENARQPPLTLPQHVSRFLASVLHLDEASVQLCWTAFRDVVLRLEDSGSTVLEDDLFRVHGRANMISRNFQLRAMIVPTV
jgi:hypothetical protein